MVNNNTGFTEEQLATELRNKGLFTTDGMVKKPAYDLGVEILPVVCVDIIPVKTEANLFKIGTIIRATGPESGKSALPGGRVRRDQKISEAISHHLKTDLEISEWKFYPGNEEDKPFYVQQYFQNTSAEGGYGYDPTKHAIALTYLIIIAGEPRPGNEAGSFSWITEEEIPIVTGYNQSVVMKLAFDFLKHNNK